MLRITGAGRWAVVAIAVLALGGAALPAHAGELGYRFTNVKQAMYHVTIKGDLPDAIETHSGSITYDIQSVEPNGKITFSYSSGLQVHKEQRRRDPRDMRFPPIPRPSWPSGPREAPQIVISPTGAVLRSNRVTDDAQLPFMLGYAWQLLLEPLPANDEPTWAIEGPISIYTKQKVDSWPPRGPFHREQEVRTDQSAQQTVTYAVEKLDGPRVTIKRNYSLIADEKAGNEPVLQNTGSGHFVFNTQKGLIESMELQHTIAVVDGNVSVKVPVTVSARLLTDEEIAKIQADLKASREAFARAQAMSQMPEGTKQTAMVGGKGGGPYTRVDPKKIPVLGFKIEVADWGGKKCLRKVEPVYERPAAAPGTAPDPQLLLAKDGYVVSGLIVNGTEYSHAMQVVFARYKDGKIDTSDTYTSDWFGEPHNATRTTLAGNGEIIVGIFGKQGANNDGIGLVVLRDPAEDAAEKKAAAERWAKKAAGAVNVLPKMQGESTKQPDGSVLLNTRNKIATAETFKPPVKFKIVCWTEGKDFRLAHAADYIIFNWEMNPSEFRINGGPASDRHKPGAGALPHGKWVTLELVVEPNEMVIFVDGEERWRQSADFSQVDKPLTITAHQGTAKLKSVEVIK